MPKFIRREAIDLVQRISSDRRILILAWLIIAAEAAFAMYHFRPWEIGDSEHYLLLAQNLDQGRYGTVTAAGFEPDALRPPGYPIILWLLLHLVGLPIVAVVALQLVAFCAAIFAIQRAMFPRSGGALFVLVTALYPFPLLYSVYLLTEAWAIAATTAAALLVVRRDWRRYALAGMAAGAGALIRTDLLLLPLLLAAILFIRDRGAGESWLSAAKLAILPPLAAGALLLPYAIWNEVNFGRLTPVPVAGAVGTSLYLSTWQDQLDWDDIDALERGRITGHMEEIGLAPAVRKLNHEIGAPENILAFDPHAYPTVKLRIAAGQAFKRAAIQRISADPMNYAGHIVHNLWALWVTKRYSGLPTSVSAGLMISSFLVFLLGFAGMGVSLVRPRTAPLPWLLVPVALYPFAIHLWLHTEARYTAATRPLLIMFAAGFVIWLARPANREHGAPQGFSH